MQRARYRTLRLTVIIVLAFFLVLDPVRDHGALVPVRPGRRRAREWLSAVVPLHVRRVQLVGESARVRQLHDGLQEPVGKVEVLLERWRQDWTVRAVFEAHR
uniref:Putative secreted protein n=1 Tax=Ixodes ricinus TaxID=34613 RepID=A0A6B0UHF7_IXORI